MAQEIDITLVPNTPTLLTNSDAANFRAQTLNDGLVRFKGTVGATPPTTFQGGINLYNKGDLLPADLTLLALFPFVVGVNRVYAYSDTAVTISVSHD